MKPGSSKSHLSLSLHPWDSDALCGTRDTAGAREPRVKGISWYPGLWIQPQGGNREPGDHFINRMALSVEVMIIMIIFNKFPTKGAEGVGLCGVWGAGSAVLLKWQSLCPLCLPVPGVRQEWSLCGRSGGGVLRDIWPVFAECLSCVSGCPTLGPLYKRGEADCDPPAVSMRAAAGGSLGSKPQEKGPAYPNLHVVSLGRLPGRGGI